MQFKKLEIVIKRYMPEIHSHPFNDKLCSGTLPLNTFKGFLEQDQLYLIDYSKALSRMAKRLPNEKHQHLFHQLSIEVFEEQVNLHQKYLPNSHPQPFFQPVQSPVKKISVIDNYTKYLLQSADSSPVEEAVVSLLPCFYIYRNLGLDMCSKVKENNPYRPWIDSYSNEQFLLSTQLMIEAAKEMSNELTFSQEKKIMTAFVKSIEFEISFWDHIYGQSVENQQEEPCIFSV